MIEVINTSTPPADLNSSAQFFLWAVSATTIRTEDGFSCWIALTAV